MDAEEETDVRESEEIQDLRLVLGVETDSNGVQTWIRPGFVTRATVWLVFLVNLVLQVSLDLRGFLEKQAHQDPLCWEQLEREGPLETLEPPGPQDQQDPQGPEVGPLWTFTFLTFISPLMFKCRPRSIISQ